MIRPESRTFVESILAMGHNLGMRVIVEGIETEEQLQLIRALRANEAQGFLLGRPTADPMARLRRGWDGSLGAGAQQAESLRQEATIW
jgi:EAL domain-containing protein (putative c-di-GMP-specific phosphodiesterase class I)